MYNEKQREMTRNIVSFAPLFRAFYPIPKPKGDLDALNKFLQNYAHERQGAARAYRTISRRVITSIFKDGILNITKDNAIKAWNLYQTICRNEYPKLGLNPDHNPLNSSLGVIHQLAKVKNTHIYNYVKDFLIHDEVEKAHSFLKSIRGVGEKISSLYLRDIASLELDAGKQDHYLYQPIDTWLDQALLIILGKEIDVPKKTSDKQRIIIDLCKEAGYNPIEFNQGAWFSGSVIALDYGVFTKIIKDINEAKAIIQERISLEERKIIEYKKWLNRTRS